MGVRLVRPGLLQVLARSESEGAGDRHPEGIPRRWVDGQYHDHACGHAERNGPEYQDQLDGISMCEIGTGRSRYAGLGREDGSAIAAAGLTIGAAAAPLAMP